MTGRGDGASRSVVYPRPPDPPLLVSPAASGELAITQLAGPPVSGLPYEQMMFLGIAVSGGPAEPTFAMTAGNGEPVSLSQDPAAIHRSPGQVGYVGDVWIDGVETRDVHRIAIGFAATTTEQWRLRVRNTDGSRAYRFVCVVGDTPDNTLRPWIDVSPPELEFDQLPGVMVKKTFGIANHGTATFTVTDVGPLPAALTITTPLPMPVAPGSVSPLEVAFTAPGAPSGPDALLTASAALSIAPPDDDSGTRPGHNGSLTVQARTRRPPPTFASPGRQLSPSNGPAGTLVRLSGSGFDGAGLMVRFGDIDADAPAVVTASSIDVELPGGLLSPGETTRDVHTTVATDAGSAVSTDVFLVTSRALPGTGDRILYYGASSGRGAIGRIDGDDVLSDARVIPAGSFAKDWTQIVGLSGDRILYYGASSGRGAIGRIDGDGVLSDVRVIPAGSFATDWTQIAGL